MSDKTKKTTPAPAMEYNAPRFKISQYNFDVFGGPAAGEEVGDYTFTDFGTGEPVELSSYRGKWLVIETGSSTCSMYTKNISGMKSLASEFPDVDFVIVYVREAHPGERLHQHKTFQDKMSAAKHLKPLYDEDRRVLVDTIDGAFHRDHGAMPNVVYVIRPDGTVHYRCNWATVYELRVALEDRKNFHTIENADMEKLQASHGLLNAIRTMWLGGFIALWDFLIATPQLMKRHKLVDEYYAKHGKFKKSP